MGYGMIAEVGNLLVGILCRELVPDIIPHNHNIGLCSPDDHGDLNLGVYLYDVNENEDIRAAGMRNAGAERQVYPSVYLNLYYMITAYSESDRKFRAAEEQRILGRTMQALRDHSVLAEGLLGEDASMPARIELQRMERHEKMRLWNFPNIPYKLSLFYRVQPVEISSARTRQVTRVREVAFLPGKDRITFHASLVVLVIDDFTGKPVAGSAVRVSVPGQKAAVVKGDGYHVFVNLEGPSVTLLCDSPIYEQRRKQVELTEGRENEVIIIRLLPNASYPMPANTTCVSGKTQPGRRLLFWIGHSRGYRLLDDYCRQEKEQGYLIAIFNPGNQEMEGKTFLVCCQQEKEFFSIVGKAGQHYRMDRVLSRDYKKIGTVIVPVYEVAADEKGDFFLPVMAGNGQETELVCQAEGGQGEKKFQLLPGKNNVIMV